MIAVGEVQSGFLFQSVILGEAHRPPIDLFDFAGPERLRAQTKDLPIVSMCSYCQKVKDSHHAAGERLEAEEYYAGGTSKVQINHGICSRCYDEVFPPRAESPPRPEPARCCGISELDQLTPFELARAAAPGTRADLAHDRLVGARLHVG